MATSQVDVSFLELLEKSELLPEADAARLRESFAAPDAAASGTVPAARIARRLVKSGALTKWQARRLLEGHYRGFFIDHFKLLEVLGDGGMGRVYVAEDVQDGSRVALKVLSERCREDAGMIARLKMEGRAGSRLNHPNIVRTVELGHSEDVHDVHYVVMELVRGVTLHELIASHGPLATPQAADVVMQAALGLDHAHQAGLVHRDVKPANLLVEASGQTKILDFGLALSSHDEEQEFSLAMIFGHECLGSAEYMPPEQSLDSMNVDVRADVYSLGCTFYSALTGRFPFSEETTALTVAAHREKDPRPLSRYVPELPEAIGAIVMKMMARDPEDRYQSAAEVVEALRPHAERKPLDFDFDGAVAKRAEQAKRKSDAWEARRSSAIRSRSTVATAIVETDAAGGSSGRGTGSSAAMRNPSSSVSGRITVNRRPASSTASSTVSSTVSSMATPSGPVPSEVAAEAIDHAGSGSAAEGENGGTMCRLVPVDSSGNRGAPIPVTGDKLSIGRSRSCDVELSSSAISGRHCELRRDGGLWSIVDLDSKNGVGVNGKMVKEQVLLPGDRLSIAGRQEFLFSPAPESDATRPGFWKLLAAIIAVAALTSGSLLWWFLQ